MDPRANLPTAITTDRLLLATPSIDHVPTMAVLANDHDIYALLARLPHPYEQSHGHHFVDTIARGPTEHAWSILHAGHFIGVIGLHLIDDLPPDLGYWLGKPFWGQGFGSEAAIAVVSATRQAGFGGMRARALTSNHASRKVLRKAGFIETAEGPAPDGTNKGNPTTFMVQEFGL